MERLPVKSLSAVPDTSRHSYLASIVIMFLSGVLVRLDCGNNIPQA